MKRFLGALTLLIAAPVMAVNVVIPVPNAAVANLQENCEVLRVSMEIQLANWNDGQCGYELVRIGNRTVENVKVSGTAEITKKETVSAALGVHDTNYPRQEPAYFCGDGEIESEFSGEECDDSGESATCNVDCSLSVCGDGIVNTTAGEECDDVDLPIATCTVECLFV